MLQPVKVAVVQSSPVLFDQAATLEKTCDLIRDISGKDVQLILFPEAFIPAYPRGLGFGAVVGSRSDAGRRTYERYWANAIEVPGPPLKSWGKRPGKPASTWPSASLKGKPGSGGGPSIALWSISARMESCWANTENSSPRVPSG